MLDYLYRRGLTDADIRRFGLGASPSGWEDGTKALMEMGHARETLAQARAAGEKVICFCHFAVLKEAA